MGTTYYVKVFPNAQELQTFLTSGTYTGIDGVCGWHGIVLLYHITT
jgi:hypothetical protein